MFKYAQVTPGSPVYLLLPSNSTFTRAVDSTQYSAIKFSFTNENVVDKTTIRFIVTPNNQEHEETRSQYALDGMVCDLNDHESTNSNCFITRYWPYLHYPVYNTSFISCKSDIQNGSKKSFLVWKWFSVKTFKKSSIDLNIDCPQELLNTDYFECSNLDNLFYIKPILQTNANSDSIVVMRFCTNSDIDAVEYRAQFNEYRLVVTGQYNQYTMGLNTDSLRENVTVPLTTEDKFVRIVVDGNIQPVEIQMQYIASAARLLKNEIFAFDVAMAFVITAIVLLIICGSIIAVVCIWRRRQNRAQ